MTKTKKLIVFYISHLNFGGAEKSLLSLIPFISRLYRVILISDLNNSSLFNEFYSLQSRDFKLMHLQYPFTVNKLGGMINLIYFFLKLCLKRKIDFFVPLLLNNSYTIPIVRFISPRTKTFIWEHTIVSRHYPKNYILLKMFYLADKIFFPSRICAIDMLSHFPALDTKVVTIPNPCTLNLDSISKSSSNDISMPKPNGHLNLAVIGRLSEEKQVEKTIYCVRRLLGFNYIPRLDIIGSGNQRSSLISLVDYRLRILFISMTLAIIVGSILNQKALS